MNVRGKPYGTTVSARTRLAYLARLGGSSYADIGRELGVTRNRARQLVKRYETVLASNRRVLICRAHTARIQDPDGILNPVTVPVLATKEV